MFSSPPNGTYEIVTPLSSTLLALSDLHFSDPPIPHFGCSWKWIIHLSCCVFFFFSAPMDEILMLQGWPLAAEDWWPWKGVPLLEASRELSSYMVVWAVWESTLQGSEADVQGKLRAVHLFIQEICTKYLMENNPLVQIWAGQAGTPRPCFKKFTIQLDQTLNSRNSDFKVIITFREKDFERGLAQPRAVV